MRERQGTAFATGSTVREAIKQVLPFHPTAAQNASARYITIDIQAAGTWTKMIRYALPCTASTGATKKPM